MSRWVPLNLPAGYSRSDFGSDVGAGAITATLLIPQAMAYSQLAGLPPEIGLYASMVPPVLYALAGSSRTLAVGPVAVASLMLAGSLATIWPVGSAGYLAGAVVVAALSGLILLIMGFARLGMVANLLSHPVLSGFTNAAAVVIILSQLGHLLGLASSQGGAWEIVKSLVGQFGSGNSVTIFLGGSALVLLWSVARFGARLLAQLGFSNRTSSILIRLAPLLLVVTGIAVAAGFELAKTADVAITGAIPKGLPTLSLPSFDVDVWARLFGASIAIALVSFVESLAIAKVLAARRRERIDPNRELIGLGIANLGASVTGASPVCGGFSRSVVNFEAGAQSQVASLVCSLLIALTALFFTPWLYHLPSAVLAAIVVVSVAGLFELGTLRLCLRYDKADAVALVVTFATVIAAGMEMGIAVGVALSLLLFLWRTSQPHMAIVGRMGDSQHFRNVERHLVTTYRGVLAIRIDESLYFANVRELETRILNAVSEQPDVRHLLLILSAVNSIDTSALQSLQNLVVDMREAGITIHLAEVKGPLADRLNRSELLNELPPGKMFLSVHEAMNFLPSLDAGDA